MAKQYVTQEVYDAAKNVLNKKSAYEWGEANGDPNFKVYEEEAVPYYEVLKSNDSDTYNMLKHNNFSQANDIFKNYAVARDEKNILNDIGLGKYGWANAKTDDDKNKFQANTAQFYDELAFVNPQLADIVKGWDYNQLNSYITTGKMPEIKTPEVATENAFAKPMTGAEAGTRGFNLIGDSGNTILSNIDKMYFDGNFGKDVADMFNMYGNTEGAKELAKNAAANGGNFDSFADYNRHNTNLAYMLAGQNAVQNMRRGYAEDATSFLDAWGNQLTDSASNIADYEYKDKALASDEKVDMAQDATDRMQIASDERIAQMSADAKKAVAQIEADAESKGYSAKTINAIISGVTDLILKGKDYSVLQEFLDQYGVKLPEQAATTTGTVVPSGFGGKTEPDGTKSDDTKYDNTSTPITDAEYNEILAAGKDHQNDETVVFLTWLTGMGFDKDAARLISNHKEVINIIDTLVENGYKKEAYMFAAANGFNLENVKDTIK